jgi:hypothetical protein
MIRRRSMVLALPLALGLIPIEVRAQADAEATRADARWLEDCHERDMLEDPSRDEPRACEILVDSVPRAAETIVIESTHNGGIEIRGWDRPGIEVHARIQTHGETPAAALERARRVGLDLSPGAVRVSGDVDRGAVSFEILVPRRSGLEAATYNGPLKIQGVEGTMRVATHNGPLALIRVGGDVVARVQNGPLSVKLDGDRWRGEGLDAEAVNGPVTLDIPDGYSAELEVGTIHGPFDVDIPITLEPGVRFPGHVRTRLGGGGPRIRVVTTNGPIVVRRS